MNFTHNPSEEVAKKLNGHCAEYHNIRCAQHPFRLCIEGVPIPVNDAGAMFVADKLRKTNKTHHWDGIIHLGLEDYARGLKLETVAANVKAVAGGQLVPGKIEVLPTTADLSCMLVSEMVSTVLADVIGQNAANEMIDESWSRDAGTYYCNEVYFRTLHAVRLGAIHPPRSPGLVPVLFVHLPNTTTVPFADSARLVALVAAHLVAGNAHLHRNTD
eukprot:comp17208_c0_seq1/m.16154 comp17208_c0_seq1/g.16154  ORF comp17208_c0_seq1/g.16154 comp17208_c0_seq1/m.16154 type:complete len:216 (-) comp17208_c0_seq1:172-819(-)